MHLPGIPSLVFLAVILVFLPFSAVRSAARLRAMRNPDGAYPELSRVSMLGGTLFVQVAILILAAYVGHGFGFDLFVIPELGGRAWLLTAIAFALCMILRQVAAMFRSEAERRKLFVFQLVPRNGREWILWTVVVLAAGVSEEAAYRGVGMAILTYMLGNAWIAALLSAIAFAVAHSVQGWKSGIIIFLIAVVMHGLVALTGTLILAMGVHILYDLVAGVLISAEAKRMEREGVAELPDC